MKISILIAVVALAGCTTTGDVMSQQPVETLYSENPPAVVASCLAYKNDAKVQEQADGSKLVLLKNMYNALFMAFTINPHDAGSQIVMRKGEASGVGFKYKDCVS